MVVKLVIHPISIGEDKTGDIDNLINDFRESQRPGTKSVWLTKRGSFISDCLWDGTKRKTNVCDKGLWRYRVCPFATGVVNGKPEKEFRVTVFSLGLTRQSDRRQCGKALPAPTAPRAPSVYKNKHSGVPHFEATIPGLPHYLKNKNNLNSRAQLYNLRDQKENTKYSPQQKKGNNEDWCRGGLNGEKKGKEREGVGEGEEKEEEERQEGRGEREQE